jgi:Tol biopolymer transport system component
MFKPSVLKHWTIPSIFVFAALTLVFTLTGAHLAQAGGFNVDSLVTFTPLPSTYRTVSNTTGCPAGFVGKFTFTAQLTNKPTGPGMPGLDVLVQTLTNGNVLLDPQTNTVLGGQGSVMEIPQVGQYADGLLSADETVEVPFVVCLKTRQSFQFFVDVFGVVTELVSVNRFETNSGNSISSEVSLSADGRFVAFHSYASDLVTNDANGQLDVFVRDLRTGATALVSVNRFGTASGNGSAGGPGGGPAISADGRLVAFTSHASDLVANDTNGQPDAFVRDLEKGTTTLVSLNRFGTNGGNGASGDPRLSADGRFVAFRSSASDLVDENDTNRLGGNDVFVRDLQTGTTTLVSVNRAGTDSGNDPSGNSGGFAMSTDGRFVAFTSNATDLVATDTNGREDVFVRPVQQ